MKSLRMLRFGALAAVLLAGAMPASADIQIKDGNGTLQTLCTTPFGSPTKHAYCHTLVDINGVAFGTLANPFHVTLDGASLTIGTLPALASGTNTIGSIANITGTVPLPTGAAKESGGNLDAINGKLPALGQKAKAGSIGVSLPLDPDILTAAATLTAADAASTTAAGQNSVSVISGTPTAGSVYAVALNGQSEAVFTISGAFVGTLQFEGSANSGSTWTPRSAHVMGTKYRQVQVTGPGIYHVNAAGLTNVRARVVGLTSGTPSAQLNTTASTGSAYVMNDIELVDLSTGLSPSIKAGGASITTDPALTVQNPNEAAALTALNLAIGDCTAAAYAGTGTGTLCSVLKGLFGQAAPTSLPGTSIGGTTPVPGFQGVAGGVPLSVTGTVTTQSGTSLASPAYRIASAAPGNNAQVFATGAKRMLHAYFCNKATSDRVLKFYDKATTPVPGTDAIVTSIGAPAGSCPVIDFSSGGFPFVNGLAVAITLPGDNDTGSSVAAGDITGLNIQHN